MAKNTLHDESRARPTCSILPTLSREALAHAAVLQKLVDDLQLDNPLDPDGSERMLAVFTFLLNGEDDLSMEESRCLRLMGRRALVASNAQSH